MSHNLPQASSSANYQAIFDDALRAYEKKTGKDLASDPLLRRLESCNSPDTVIDVLQEQIPGIDQPGSKLTTWVKPTINVLYTFSSTIGAGVSLAYPPAGVIVTGISNLLSAVQGASASQDALLDIFERIENVFRRLETYTELPQAKEMTDIIIKVMVEVLLILALVTKEIKQGKLKRFLKKVVGMSEIDGALRRLDKLTQEEHRMATAQDLRVTHGVRDDTKHIKAELNHQKWDQLWKDLTTWLSPPDPFINYNTASDARHGGTGVWFIESSGFKGWKESASLLWIYGKPGAGKSVITSAIIQDIKDISNTGPAYMAFFFFDFKDIGKQDSRALLSSVIVQLSRRCQSFYDILFDFYSAHAKGSQQPSIGALTKCLEGMIKASGDVPIYLILDALDECPDTKGTTSCRQQVLDILEKLVKENPPRLHVCITSRPEVDIRASLEPLTSESNRICLHDQIGQKEDITKFVRGVVHSNTNMRRWRDWDKQLVIEMLSEKANGMFRWVSCQLEVLQKCLPSSVRGVLADLPESLDETYERILQQIPKPNRVHAHRLFQCLVVAAYPLNVEELAEILAIDFSATGMTRIVDEDMQWEDKERALLLVCSSLITIVQDRGSRVIQFSHFSVKEFLTSDRLAASTVDTLRYHHIALEPAHMMMTISCLKIMQQGLKFNICGLKSSYDMNNEVEDIFALVGRCIPSYLAYACQNWADHLVGIASGEERDSDIVNLLRHFLNFHLLYWLEALSLLSISHIASRSLLIAAEWLEATDKDLSLAASDARQFSLTFADVITESAPHIYLSALPFAPPSSLVSKRYRDQFPRTIKVSHEEGTKWPAIAYSISISLGYRVYCLSVHPDGKRVAAATSGNTALVISVATGDTLFNLAGHGDCVGAIAYATNGQRIATGCADGCLRIYEAENGLLLFGPFGLHSGWILSVSWSPDGRRIVTGSEDQKVKVVAAETGQVIYDTAFHDDWVRTVVFTSEFFISGSDDRTVRIYDSSTGTASGEAWSTGQTGDMAIAMSPDNSILAAGGGDCSIILYNMDTRSVIDRPMRGHRGAIRSLAFSKDGQLLASGSEDSTVRLWNVRTGTMICDPLCGHTDYVNSVTFSPDMKQLITGSKDCSMKFFDMDSLPVRKNSSGATHPFRAAIPLNDGKTIVASDGSSISRWTVDVGRVEDVTFKGNSEHLEGIQSVSISPDGRLVATAASNCTVMIWQADSGKALWGPLERHWDDIYALSFSVDSKMVVSGSHDWNVWIWSAETGQSICGPMGGHTSSVNDVCFSPDGKQVASGSVDCNAIIWSVESGDIVHGPLVYHQDRISSLAYAPNGLYLATASEDYTVAIWDVATGDVFNTLTGYRDCVRLVNWSPDSKRIVTATLDNAIRISDVETGIPLCEHLSAHHSDLTAISMRPSLYSDDPEVISASLDGAVRVSGFRSDTFVKIRTFSGFHSHSIRTIAFSPVDDHIASGADDGRLVVMDIVTGQSKVCIYAHQDRIHCVAYSLDGKKIGTCSDDHIINIWDAENGERLLEPLEGHTDVVLSIEFSPCGNFLVSGSADGTIRTWDLHPSTIKLNNPIRTYRGHRSAVNAVAYAREGEFIVSGSADAEIAIWEGSLSDKCLRQFGGYGGAVLSIRVFDDKIFSSSEDRTVRIWELSTGHALKSISTGHTGRINAIALTPDGNRIVSASDDASLRIFDSETGEPCSLPLRMSQRMFDVAVSHEHDGALVACSCADGRVHVWRANMARRAVWPNDFIRKAGGLEFCLVDEQGFLADPNPPDGGWLRGSTYERMYWIPLVYRAGLWTPRTVGILGALETIVDLRNFVHGTDWEQCRAQVFADKA